MLYGDESSHGVILSHDTPEPHITRLATKRKKQGMIAPTGFTKEPTTEGSNMAGKFNLDEYETVAEGLLRLYKAFPEARVITENRTPEHKTNGFEFLAELYLDREDIRPVATGWAEEIVGASPVNRTSAMENCETSAIGRMLSNSVLCLTKPSDKRPSREEMEKVERYSTEPRKPAKAKEVKTYTPEQTAAAKIAISEVQIAQNIAEARRIWDSYKDLLDVPVEGTTLKDALNAKAAQLQ